MLAAIELARRVRNRLRSKATRLRHRRGWQTLPTGSVRMAEAFRHPIDAAAKASLLDCYRNKFATAAQEDLDAAEVLMRHEFHLLGHTTRHGTAIRWSLDPVSGQEWPRTFSADIPYRGAQRLGDIKLPWELAKHQYFFTLGKAAWLTGERRFAQEIVAQIDHWIAENPCHTGIHWISALESGSRALSWILSYPFFAQHCDAAFQQRMLRSIAQHLLFVEHNLSLDRFPNTHLVGEAAILVIGALFVDCAHSKRWLAIGLQHLETQMRRQVRDDGVHAEQSVAYHRFFLDQYYLVQAILRANGSSLSPATLQRMEQMTGFLQDVLHPDGTAPNFGDCDDARGIWCRSNCIHEYRSLLALGAVTFKRGDFKLLAREATEELLWLHGTGAVEEFAALPAREPDHRSAAYPHAGYYVMRSGWDRDAAMLVFDCGPLGHGPAGHGHADALSIQLYCGQQRFLIDPGTYSYNLDYQWRDRFRATRSHNTLTIDGQDQSTMRERMSWSTAANARCRRWLSTAWFDIADGEHDGYARLQHPATHRRVVVFLPPDVWVICDEVTGKGPNELQWQLHLHPDCTSAPDGSDLLLSSPTGQSSVRATGEGIPRETAARLRLHVAEHRSQQPAADAVPASCEGWYSASYGCKVPAPSLQVRSALADQTCIVTRLVAGDASVQAELEHGALKIRVQRPGQSLEELIYPLSPSTAASAAELSIDGEVFYRRGTEQLWPAP